MELRRGQALHGRGGRRDHREPAPRLRGRADAVGRRAHGAREPRGPGRVRGARSQGVPAQLRQDHLVLYRRHMGPRARGGWATPYGVHRPLACLHRRAGGWPLRPRPARHHAAFSRFVQPAHHRHARHARRARCGGGPRGRCASVEGRRGVRSAFDVGAVGEDGMGRAVVTASRQSVAFDVCHHGMWRTGKGRRCERWRQIGSCCVALPRRTRRRCSP